MNNNVDSSYKKHANHEVISISTDEELPSDPEKESMLDIDIDKRPPPISCDQTESKVTPPSASTPSLNDFHETNTLSFKSFKGEFVMQHSWFIALLITSTGIFFSFLSSIFFSLTAVIVKYLNDIHPGEMVRWEQRLLHANSLYVFIRDGLVIESFRVINDKIDHTQRFIFRNTTVSN